MSNPFESIETRLSNIENLLLDIKHKPEETENKLHSVKSLSVLSGVVITSSIFFQVILVLKMFGISIMEILKLYAGRSVHISLGVEVKTPEFSTHAALCEKWPRGTSACFRALETEDLSPATAASKMIAIAHALSRWEKKNSLPNETSPSVDATKMKL